MAKATTARRSNPKSEAGSEAVQARVREIVTAIAAEVIAETAKRLGPARRAMPLAMARGVRSGPRRGTAQTKKRG
jgi:hypothetical protein